MYYYYIARGEWGRWGWLSGVDVMKRRLKLLNMGLCLRERSEFLFDALRAAEDS